MKTYLIILTPIIAAGLAQFLKIILGKKNKMSLKDFFKLSYSGMPSGHSAFVISLVVIILLTNPDGLGSPLSALAIAFALLVIGDALKLRRYLGQQGEVINVLIRDLKEDHFLDEKYPVLRERIGHTAIEVLAGSLLGIAVAIAIYLLFF